MVEMLLMAVAFLSCQDKTDRVEQIVTREVEKENLPGVAVCVLKEGKIVFNKGYGLADLEHEVPVKPGTIFRVGSITKQFTAAAILMLKEDGKLQLDDKVSKYLPDFPHGDEVKIEHLLRHTSGLVNFTGLKPWLEKTREDRGTNEILDLFKNEPLRFTPGEKWEYCNSGYFLLGFIIEKASGMTYQEFLQTKLLNPLELKDTRLELILDIVKNRAHGYTKRHGAKWSNAEPINMSQGWAAGQIISSASDVAKWSHALHSGKIINPEALKIMESPTTLKDGKVASYGMGCFLKKVKGNTLIGHGGDINGFAAYVGYFPEGKLSVAVLTNRDLYDSEGLSVKVAQVFLS